MTLSPRRWLVVILIASVILRLGAALALGNEVVELPGTFDQLSYHRLALRVIGGHGFSFGEQWWPITAANAPTAHWSFLYTLYLAAVYTLFGPHPLAARLIQATLVGLLLPWITYQLGRQVFDEKVALVAAGIAGGYLYFVYYAGTLMTESFYIIALLTSFYLAIRLARRDPEETNRRAIFQLALAFGLSLGCAALLRQLSLLFFPFLYLWVWWAGRAQGQKRLIPALTLSTLVVGLMILPFTLYNYARFERFVLLNTNSGYAFFWGNHPIYGTQFVPILTPEMGSYQDLIPAELHHLDEAALDQALLQRGLQFILDDPLRYGLLSLSRIPAYFMFWYSSDSGLVSNISRIFSFGITWPFMLLGLLLAPQARQMQAKLTLHSPAMLLLLFAAIYTAIHLLTWALIRYRLPVDAVLIPFAALALVWLWERFGPSRP
jgi:4-amino-4-deoxy-L-arabinose transferase-like glycosyltransferase